MAGIASYGAYIPIYRLSRPDIQKAWDSMIPIPGEKAVAGYDEDSITMAVAAARDCLTGIDRQKVDRVYFASTTSPYKEKQAASVVAGALGLGKDTLTMDFSGSLRSGTNALRAAADAIDAGSANCVLVTCAETRLGAPNGDKEMSFGDGAAALLVAKNGPVNIEGSVSTFQEIHDQWRSDKDTYSRIYAYRTANGRRGSTEIQPQPERHRQSRHLRSRSQAAGHGRGEDGVRPHGAAPRPDVHERR
jgi:3-hydroxy-3-methylglutaryl CoA synthase